MIKKRIIFLVLPCLFVIATSCENDIAIINKVASSTDAHIETINEVHTFYSVNGRVKAQLLAPILQEHNTKEPFKELPKGVTVLFYNELKKEEGRLKAKYGISYERQHKIVVKNNVEVVNIKSEKLNTEELTWDTEKHLLYTDKPVKINTGKEVLFGEGMTAKEDFSEYKIKHLTGIVKVKNDF